MELEFSFFHNHSDLGPQFLQLQNKSKRKKLCLSLALEEEAGKRYEMKKAPILQNITNNIPMLL